MEGEDYDWHEALDILTDAKGAQEKKNTSWLVSCKSDIKKPEENHYSAIEYQKYILTESSSELSKRQEKAIEYLSYLSRAILQAKISAK